MRRFLLHVLPSGFVRIRHFGFLSNRNRAENIQRCRKLLDVNHKATVNNESNDIPEATCLDGADAPSVTCPECQSGQLVNTLIRRPIVGLSTRRALRLFESGLEFQDSSWETVYKLTRPIQLLIAALESVRTDKASCRNKIQSACVRLNIQATRATDRSFPRLLPEQLGWFNPHSHAWDAV